jgi:hypothetical protein
MVAAGVSEKVVLVHLTGHVFPEHSRSERGAHETTRVDVTDAPKCFRSCPLQVPLPTRCAGVVLSFIRLRGTSKGFAPGNGSVGILTNFLQLHDTDLTTRLGIPHTIRVCGGNAGVFLPVQ